MSASDEFDLAIQTTDTIVKFFTGIVQEIGGAAIRTTAELNLASYLQVKDRQGYLRAATSNLERDLKNYAKRMERYLPAFEQAWNQAGISANAMLSEYTPHKQELSTGIAGLRKATSGARESLRTAIDALTLLSGSLVELSKNASITNSANKASEATVRANDVLLLGSATFERIMEQCDELLE